MNAPGRPGDPVIRLERVSRVYQVGESEVRALDNVSLSIERGDFVAVMGPSGSGKSTMLNVLGCLDTPTAGSYVLDGEAVESLSQDRLAEVRQKRIGFVFQSYHLISRMTAARNVELPMIFAGTEPRERRERVRAALESVGLSHRIDHRPTQLSGGERQRVAIARAVVMQPSILLADEPTGNLDTRSGEEIIALLETLNRNGLTLVLVTHDPRVASHARRVLVMRDGQIVEDKSMRRRDLFEMAFETLRIHRLRTGLTLAAIAIGVTAVLLLTALGDAAKGYVVQEFATIGTNLVIILPGKAETSGSMPAFGGATRDLTIEDYLALVRQCPAVRRAAPLSIGNGAAEYGGLSRDIRVFGTTADLLHVRKLSMAVGQFLPEGDPSQGDRVVVLGTKVARELFQGENPLGKLLRIAEWRFRVIGVLAPKGNTMGVDWDDQVIVPVSVGLKMFDQSGLFRIMTEAVSPEAVPLALDQIKAVLMSRHDDEEDFTMITQNAMLATFGSVIDALTAGLAGIAAISLAVAGIGIMNVMLVSVSERTGEVGLLKALGARRRQIMDAFLAEALMLSSGGALIGIVVGVIVILSAAGIWPFVPIRPNPGWIALVLVLAVIAGVAFGLMPARRAAALDPADALRGKH